MWLWQWHLWTGSTQHLEKASIDSDLFRSGDALHSLTQLATRHSQYVNCDKKLFNDVQVQRNRYKMPAVIRTGREADLLPPSSDDGKNEWSYTSTPRTYLMACTRASFTTQHRCIGVLAITTVWITRTCGKMWQRPAVRSVLTESLSAVRNCWIDWGKARYRNATGRV